MIFCDHWSDCGIPSGGCCAANHYGGSPSRGICARCEHRVVSGIAQMPTIRQTEQQALVSTVQPAVTPPTPERRLGFKHYLSALPKIATAAVTLESDMSRRRLEICKTCENWTGRTCKVCGCYTAMKVRLPAEACPIGKWSAER